MRSSPQVETGAPRVDARWMAAGVALLVALSVLVFEPVIRVRFLADDYSYLNTVQVPGWWHSSAVWDPGAVLYRPVLFLWFGLLRSVGGVDATTFHVAALAVVVVSGILAGLVASRLGLRWGAYVATVIVTLHAAGTVQIGWASAANSAVAMMLALAVLYLLLRPRVRTLDWVLASTLFALALMTREVVAVTPAMLLIGRFAIDEQARLWDRVRRALVVSSPLWGVLVGYLVVRRAAGFEGSRWPYEQGLGFHAFDNLYQLMRFATGVGGLEGASGGVTIVLWALLVLLCVGAAVKGHRSQGLLGLGWALLGAVPVIFLTQHGMRPYYVGFAVPGVAIAAGTVLEWAAARMTIVGRVVFAVAMLSVFVCVSMLTVRSTVEQQLQPWTRQTQRLERVTAVDNAHRRNGEPMVVRYGPGPALGLRWLTAYGNLFRVQQHDPALPVRFLPRDAAARQAADAPDRGAQL